jgi:hypothetical protein
VAEPACAEWQHKPAKGGSISLQWVAEQTAASSVSQRGCLRLRENPNDFVDLIATNRVGRNDRLWHTLAWPVAASLRTTYP